mgnify:CR=1 FL=1
MQITLKVSEEEKNKFKVLANLEDKTITQLIKDLINDRLKNKRLTAQEIRKLPRDLRKVVLQQMTEEAIPVYNKHFDDLQVEEIDDGIE